MTDKPVQSFLNLPKRYATARSDTVAPKPVEASPAAAPTLHFVAGLPRSGATVLMSLLHQNPRIHAAPVSGLGHLVHEIALNWDANPYHTEGVDPEGLERVLGAVLRGYHATSRPIILDKQRMWPAAITHLETVLGRPVKMLAPVRPLPEIVASFEALRQRHPEFQTAADRMLGASSSVRTRAELLIGPNGTLGQALQGLRAAVEAGYRDRLLFIDYNRLMADPLGQLHRIYAFLDEPDFDHDLERIAPLGRFDSRAQGYAGLHDIRPSLRRTSVDPREILGAEVFATLDGPAPWDAFID
jgi:sulfotransferase